MIRTRAGYCGGATPAPTYRSMGDHTETISVDYDPAVISLEELLDHFWEAHNCERNHPGRQYRNVVFHRDERQKTLIEASRDRQAEKLGLSPEAVRTHIEPVTPFTYAEGYHQNYLLTRHSEIRSFLEEVYPDPKDFADSAVATRLNAWLGWGREIDADLAREELETFGLPERLAGRVRATLS